MPAAGTSHSSVEDAVDGRLSLDWRETGGPPVSPPQRKGFGSRLIERGLRGELRGSASVTYDPAGLHCAMEACIPPNAATPGLYPEL